MRGPSRSALARSAVPSRRPSFALAAALVVSSALEGVAHADEPSTALPSPAEVATDDDADPPEVTPAGQQRLEREEAPLARPATPIEWTQRYRAAHAKLRSGNFADAAVLFAELEQSAVNDVDRALAHAQRTLADAWASRDLVFVPRRALAKPAVSAPASNRRSTDELVSLYTNGVVYGLGSAVWLGVLAEPKTTAAAVIPGLALTAGSVGAIVALDSGGGLHYGVPQAIVSGLWIGFEHGLVWSLYHDSLPASRREVRDDASKAYATALWGLSTVGAVAGGVLGETLGTTPGRSGWVGSTALWTGAIAGFATGAAVRNGESEALALGGLGLSVGTGIGLLTASAVSPSIGRTRLIDLSGVLGGLGCAGVYVAGSSNAGNGQGASGATALGIAGGLALGWIATSGMAKDAPAPAEPQEEDGSPSNRRRASEPDPAAHGSTLESIAAQARPLLLPQPSGAIIGAGGTF